jgi:hypothetical protein
MVMNNSLKTVCEKHNINFSSAKNVIQIFKKEGRLEKKVMRTRKNKKSVESKCDPTLFGEAESEDEKQDDNNLIDTKNHQCNILLQL